MGLWDALEAGNLRELKWLVGKIPSQLNARGPYGKTPLMEASDWNHAAVVSWLLDIGVAIEERDDGGATALSRVSRDGSLPMVRLLLERGADPTTADDWGTTPLMAASGGGTFECVRELLGHPQTRATINHRNIDGSTALWVACYWGCVNRTKALLECGADPTIARDDGTTPMAIAKVEEDPRVFGGRPACVAVLEVCPTFPPLLRWSAG
jgi:ankyrin repeat protein